MYIHTHRPSSSSVSSSTLKHLKDKNFTLTFFFLSPRCFETLRVSQILQPRPPKLFSLVSLSRPTRSLDPFTRKRNLCNIPRIINIFIRKFSPRVHSALHPQQDCDGAQRGRHRFTHFWLHRSHDDVVAENLHDAPPRPISYCLVNAYHSPPSLPRVEDVEDGSLFEVGCRRRSVTLGTDFIAPSWRSLSTPRESYFTLYQGQALLASNSNGIKYIPFGNDSAKFSLSRSQFDSQSQPDC